MDAGGNIYELTDEQRAVLDGTVADGLTDEQVSTLKQDVARLDGFMRGRAESDRGAHEKLVHDSSKYGTYRKALDG